MFNTKGLSTTTESIYIKPGIHEVIITGITGDDSGKDPIIDMTFEDSNKKIAAHRFYIPNEGGGEESDKSRQQNLTKIKHIATKLTTEQDFDDMGAMSANIQQYARNLDMKLTGKKIRIKFSGKEVLGKGEGKTNWFKAVLSGNRFAESIDVNPTKLVFDPNNEWDMRKLPKPSTVSADGSNDLPF